MLRLMNAIDRPISSKKRDWKSPYHWIDLSNYPAILICMSMRGSDAYGGVVPVRFLINLLPGKQPDYW